jgi:hypothetical protein
MLSSSTRRTPSESRTRSSPVTQPTDFTSTPSIQGSKCAADSIARAGIRPAATMARSP